MTDLKLIAQRALTMLDLTNLNDDCDEAAIEALAARARDLARTLTLAKSEASFAWMASSLRTSRSFSLPE